jgi:hypothetical protein
MSRYTVTWLKEVEGDLAGLWLGSSDRRSVAAAANVIDVELATDAERKGAEVSEGLRSLHVSPLYVLYIVREPDRLVEMVSLRSDRLLSESSEPNGNKPAPR